MDKLPLSMARSLGLIVYKYPEGSVKRTLERELSVPECADCDFDGWRALPAEDCGRA